MGNLEHNHILVLGGAFSTGKSTMLEQLQADFGEKYHYIMDGGRAALQEVAQGRTPEKLTQEELTQVQRLVIDHYVDAEAAIPQGKLTIADGSLIEAAAYSQFILPTKDMVYLNALLRYRDWHQTYTYVKFPPVLPIEYDGVRHSDYDNQVLIDQRIDRVLAKNSFPVVRIVSDEFVLRYAQVLRTLFTVEQYEHTRRIQGR